MTEQMLVHQERERDYLYLNKIDMNTKPIQDKCSTKRANRTGIIR